MRKNLILSLLTGVLLSFAFPPFRIGFMAYWGLVPFFYLLENKDPKKAFQWGYVAGVFITLGSINAASLSTIRGLFLAILLNPFYFGLFASIHRFLQNRLDEAFVFVVPFLWVAIEYLRALNGFGLTWSSLGYTHTQYLYLLREAAEVSLYTISLWVTLINSLIYLALKNLQNKIKVAYLIAIIVLLFLLPWYISKQVMPEQEEFDEGIEFAFAK